MIKHIALSGFCQQDISQKITELKKGLIYCQLVLYNRNMLKNNTYSKGFTLVELTVAVLVIMILAAICVPAYLTHVEKARGSAALENLNLIRSAEMLYRPDHSAYTPNTALLQSYTHFILADAYWTYTLTNVTDTTFTAVATRASGPYTGNTITIDVDNAGASPAVINLNGVDYTSGGKWP
jgi:prepilin-type N-terminal cleavage/methylation domain-containing protein